MSRVQSTVKCKFVRRGNPSQKIRDTDFDEEAARAVGTCCHANMAFVLK